MKKLSKIIASLLLLPVLLMTVVCCCLEDASASIVSTQTQDLPPCHQKQVEHTPDDCDCPQPLSLGAMPIFNIEKIKIVKDFDWPLVVSQHSSVFQVVYKIDSHHDSPSLLVFDLPIYLKHSNLRL